jgi:hypothetical protein
VPVEGTPNNALTNESTTSEYQAVTRGAAGLLDPFLRMSKRDGQPRLAHHTLLGRATGAVLGWRRSVGSGATDPTGSKKTVVVSAFLGRFRIRAATRVLQNRRWGADEASQVGSIPIHPRLVLSQDIPDRFLKVSGRLIGPR